MTPSLSIIMASHNDADQTVLTLKSIRETSPPADVEVIVVDDCSATPLVHYVKQDERTALVKNRYRCGCGPSRHIGAMHARGEWLLIVDSHMRFAPGWYEAWSKIPFLSEYHGPMQDGMFPTVFCATCLGLDSKHMDVANPVAEYHGATFNFYGHDRMNPKGPSQVFECVWLPREPEPEDGQEIPAIMGACYFVSREWFFQLSCLRFLRMWGGDEQALSLATWLAGGSVRLAKSVRIGHKFLIDKKEVQTYGVAPGCVIFNKLMLMRSLLPEEIAARLCLLLIQNSNVREAEVAKTMFRDNYHIVATERIRFQGMFTKSFEWFCERFQLPTP